MFPSLPLLRSALRSTLALLVLSGVAMLSSGPSSGGPPPGLVPPGGGAALPGSGTASLAAAAPAPGTDHRALRDPARRVRFGPPLPRPIDVVRPYEPPSSAFGPGHRGVDLAGTAGEPVLAAGSGTIRYAGAIAGRAVVSIEHPGGLRTTYEPVQAAIGEGRRVERGEIIGHLRPGHPGCAASACLHWGAKRGPGHVNPLGLLGGSQVRLLPWD